MAIPAPACKKALADATLRWPQRNRASDGILGDARHQARKSDHNSGNAFDVTHDSIRGPDCTALSRQVINDPRVTYVIWNSQIYNRTHNTPQWRQYTGANKHLTHMHVSIKPESRDDLSPWPWSPVEPVKPKYGDATEFVREFQRVHGLTVDGIAGVKTYKALEK